MSKAKATKLSRSVIGTNTYVQWFRTYAQWFQRGPHFVDLLVDKKNKPYFNEDERLTDAELTEIENWPGTVNELFERKESKEAKDRFLLCLSGVVEPETSTEKIVAKLIHQALAMGGLHCRVDENEYPVPEIPRAPPLNEVVNLKALPLRTFI